MSAQVAPQSSIMTRVLVVLPFYGGSLPVGRYCVDALQEVGCMVEAFEAPSFYSSFKALKELRVRQERLDYLESSYLKVVGEALLAQVERFKPDMVLCMAQAPVGIPILKRLKKDGVATAMWFVEDYRLFLYWRAFAPYYDIFAVIQKSPFTEALAEAGVENSLYLPLAAQPAIHRPMELSAADIKRFGADLSFMGAGYPNRRQAFRKLTGYDFKIWGTEWEDEPALAPHLQMAGQRISPEDAVRIFNAAKININLHSGTKREQAVTGGDFVNPRTFEIASCKAFQLVDKRALMPELFAGDELATFESMDELLAKVEYFMCRPEEREAYARRGQERVLRDHTYAARMQTLLNFAKERLPDWPPSRSATAWPEEFNSLPDEFKAQLAGLLQKLQLPAGTDFETLIATLRQHSGTLSELEAALLFLDEWKKLYNV